MATGTWDERNRPIIPGWYNRFKNKALERIGTGIHGILAMPVKANWGPIKEVVSIAVNSNAEKKLKQAFGEDSNYTAYRLGRLALLGQPKELLLYRLADSNAAIASLTLNNSEDTPKEFIKIETKYPTTRKFNVTIKTNIEDDTKKDFIFFEGTKQLFSVSAISGTADEVAALINESSNNSYIIAKKASDSATGTLSNIVNLELTGGNDGCAGVTNQDYLDAMEVFEGYEYDGFTLDGISDQALQNSVKTWIKKNETEGKRIISFVGCRENDSIDQANSRSKEFDYEGVVNVGTKGHYDDTWYTPAEVAVYIAALATGQGLGESICNAATIFDDVSPRLSRSEITETLECGTLVLTYDSGDIVVVDDVNTFKNYTDEKTKVFGNIRATKFMNAVDSDTAIKRKDFNGKVPNDDTGRALLIAALKKYFETLSEARIIKNDFTVEIDKELQAKADADEVFWNWDATYIEVMKRIYGTGNVTE